MNRRLLEDSVPREVLDYCLLHELANIAVGFGEDAIEKRRKVAEIADGYAGSKIARTWLDQVMMEV